MTKAMRKGVWVEKDCRGDKDILTFKDSNHWSWSEDEWAEDMMIVSRPNFEKSFDIILENLYFSLPLEFLE